jgi:hypothetical protein
MRSSNKIKTTKKVDIVGAAEGLSRTRYKIKTTKIVDIVADMAKVVHRLKLSKQGHMDVQRVFFVSFLKRRVG